MGGINPIPLSEIKAYIDLFGTDDEEIFVTLITTVDVRLMNHIAKAQEEKRKKDG